MCKTRAEPLRGLAVGCSEDADPPTAGWETREFDARAESPLKRDDRPDSISVALSRT
jgi:hypothetical protein